MEVVSPKDKPSMLYWSKPSQTILINSRGWEINSPLNRSVKKFAAIPYSSGRFHWVLTFNQRFEGDEKVGQGNI